MDDRGAMMLIVTSLADTASDNIRQQLLNLAQWEEAGTFDSAPAYRFGDKILVTLKEMHLYRDRIDDDVRRSLGVEPELVVYASRHKSETGVRSFTVHPLGNFAEAEYGGVPRRLVPTAPHWMTEALRALRARTREFDHTVSFEATHHGPYLETPAFYIEVGSDERAWREEGPARAIAEVLMQLQPRETPVALGIGGGHYVPRLTDVALHRRISFGHMIPTYALGGLDDELLDQAVERTPGATLAYLHRKAMKSETRKRVEAMLADCGLEVVREADLEPLRQ